MLSGAFEKKKRKKKKQEEKDKKHFPTAKLQDYDTGWEREGDGRWSPVLAQCRRKTVPPRPRCDGVLPPAGNYGGYHGHRSACFAELYGKASPLISQVIHRDCGITSVGIREGRLLVHPWGWGEHDTETESLGSRLSLEIAEKVCQSSGPSQVGGVLQGEESKRGEFRTCYL